MENKEKDFMISNFINTLIQDEWQAIEAYNSVIATLSDHPEFNNVIEILKDIRDEEYVHVGQLESCLSILSDDPTEDIEDGSEEGFEMLELDEDDEEVELELEEANNTITKEDNTTSKTKLNNDFVESFYRKHKKLIDKLGDDTTLEEEIKHTEHSLSEEEMKSIICTMIDKYDASEEEAFDELQSITPDISRDLVSRLYKMCSSNKVEENISQNEFNELWEELESLEE